MDYSSILIDLTAAADLVALADLENRPNPEGIQHVSNILRGAKSILDVLSDKIYAGLKESGTRDTTPLFCVPPDAKVPAPQGSPNGKPVPLFPGDQVRHVETGNIGEVVQLFDDGDLRVFFPYPISKEQRIPRDLLREALRHE
ncbi:hypothetical protein AGMMS50289_15780 [Betaproteobacteria bacterium]|nr:hypothetical protein AGMMS50289_15780 [Betaproteobacteria bacterium]